MRLLRRLVYWLHLRSNHAALQDELAFHREMIERGLIERGVAPAAARDQARRTMGNETAMREASRGVWLWPSLEAMWQDATYTLRDLVRNPTFSVGVILTLGLGIGANAAMFSLVDRLLLRPPARLIDPASVHRVYLFRTVDGKERQTGGQFARYVDIARWSTTSAQVAAVHVRTLAIGVGEDTRLRNVGVVSASFFNFFDAPPVRGRYFTPAEDAPPTPATVAVLSYGAWQTQFGGRNDVIGSVVRIDAVAYTIIGISPKGFAGLWPYRAPAAFIPVATFAANRNRPTWATTYTSAFGLEIIARRKPGVTVAQANADFGNALTQSYRLQLEANPSSTPIERLRLRALAGSVLKDRGPEASGVSRAATWLSGVTVTVLLIAAANVANLLLARTIRRRREIAVRIALGVSQRRLFGQLLIEGIVLALLGGCAGILMAVWGSGVLSATFLPGTDRAALITDLRTLVFAALVALGVGVFTGLAPMVQVKRHNLTGDLKSGARGGVHQPHALRTSLLLLQSALSVVLLVGAGLFVQSLRNVRDVKLGFDADSVLLVSLSMRDARLDSAAMVALRLRLLGAVRDVPGITHATLQESIPFSATSSWPLFVAGIDSMSKLGAFNANTVSADYFATMGTRIIRGRAIEAGDREGARRVVVIGASMASALWPRRDAIGQCIRIGAASTPCMYVVGVAEDIHSESIDAESNLFFYYMPAAQWRPHDGGLFVRARGDANRLVEPVRRRLQREMPGAAYVTVDRLAEVVDGSLQSWIVGARVFTAFGLLALALAAVGLYSVIAYNVTQRKHELGVRLALGAARASIVRLVVQESLRFAIAGITLGGIVALWAVKWIAPLLFHQAPRDPAVFVGVAVVLLVVAIGASAIPAFRAAGVDPKTALQSD